MHARTQKITIRMSQAERRMLEHLAMAERVTRAFIVRRLIRDAACELYEIIGDARGSGSDMKANDCPHSWGAKSV